MSGGERLTSLPTAPAPPGFAGPHSVAGEVQQFVGGVMETAMAPVNALNMAVANATLAIAQALPKFPAARLYNDLVLGWPHSHPHPPTFGTPLPSIGPVICAGAVSVLINGLPAARVGDVGFGAWCGGYFPLFEVLTGSSHVFIGGARPARTLIDFTRHCVPGVPGLGKLGAAMMVFSAGMGALSVVESLAAKSDFEAAAEEANSENEAAAMAASAAAQSTGAAVAAAQTAADLAAAALQAGMGKDPGTPPITCLGNFITGSPNVVIGGFPMPGWMMVLKGLAKLLRQVKRLKPSGRRVKTADSDVGPVACRIG
jgi:uncharacterized Zn-binding protein involved in type VI secretion